MTCCLWRKQGKSGWWVYSLNESRTTGYVSAWWHLANTAPFAFHWGDAFMAIRTNLPKRVALTKMSKASLAQSVIVMLQESRSGSYSHTWNTTRLPSLDSLQQQQQHQWKHVCCGLTIDWFSILARIHATFYLQRFLVQNPPQGRNNFWVGSGHMVQVWVYFLRCSQHSLRLFCSNTAVGADLWEWWTEWRENSDMYWEKRGGCSEFSTRVFSGRCDGLTA